jgi:peroxiredoxin
MKHHFGSLIACFLLLSSVAAQPLPYDTPPTKTAQTLVNRSLDLTGQDRVDEALTALKKAILLSPHYLAAHREYIRLCADFQGRGEAVKAEYEALMQQAPTNPVYPMALALALQQPSQPVINLYRKVVELAPDWAWAHYAQSFVIFGRTFEMMNETYGGKGEQMLAALLKAIEKAPTVGDFYQRVIQVQTTLGKRDEALATAEKMAAQSALRSEGLSHVWRLRLAQAKGSDAAKANLQTELTTLANTTRDIKLLAAIRNAYATLLKDEAQAEAMARQIRRIDPAWYPERGRVVRFTSQSSSGLPFVVMAANRQYAIYEKIRTIALRREADWRKEAQQLEALLAQKPNPALKRFLTNVLFSSARRGGDVEAMMKYAEALHGFDALEVAPFARVAMALANQNKELPKALAYARRAETALAAFRAVARPPLMSVSDFEASHSPAKQQANYRRQRALALDAKGWVLSRLGQTQEAEATLRQALELDRSETTLTHWAETLTQLGRSAEAEKITQELHARLLASVKEDFINRPAKDFALETIDGRKLRLSELKGKVVLVNFWATWCGPCIAEMPLFVRTYDKHKTRGFELLAVSVDEASDRALVQQFTKEHRLHFPVLYDEGTARLYNANGYPHSVFIDRQGNMRYVQSGAFEDGGRLLEVILNELLK